LILPPEVLSVLDDAPLDAAGAAACSGDCGLGAHDEFDREAVGDRKAAFQGVWGRWSAQLSVYPERRLCSRGLLGKLAVLSALRPQRFPMVTVTRSEAPV
jgi:hypothetical protein